MSDLRETLKNIYKQAEKTINEYENSQNEQNGDQVYYTYRKLGIIDEDPELLISEDDGHQGQNMFGSFTHSQKNKSQQSSPFSLHSPNQSQDANHKMYKSQQIQGLNQNVHENEKHFHAQTQSAGKMIYEQEEIQTQQKETHGFNGHHNTNSQSFEKHKHSYQDDTELQILRKSQIIDHGQHNFLRRKKNNSTEKKSSPSKHERSSSSNLDQSLSSSRYSESPERKSSKQSLNIIQNHDIDKQKLNQVYAKTVQTIKLFESEQQESRPQESNISKEMFSQQDVYLLQIDQLQLNILNEKKTNDNLQKEISQKDKLLQEKDEEINNLIKNIQEATDFIEGLDRNLAKNQNCMEASWEQKIQHEKEVNSYLLDEMKPLKKTIETQNKVIENLTNQIQFVSDGSTNQQIKESYRLALQNKTLLEINFQLEEKLRIQRQDILNLDAKIRDLQNNNVISTIQDLYKNQSSKQLLSNLKASKKFCDHVIDFSFQIDNKDVGNDYKEQLKHAWRIIKQISYQVETQNQTGQKNDLLVKQNENGFQTNQQHNQIIHLNENNTQLKEKLKNENNIIKIDNYIKENNTSRKNSKQSTSKKVTIDQNQLNEQEQSDCSQQTSPKSMITPKNNSQKQEYHLSKFTQIQDQVVQDVKKSIQNLSQDNQDNKYDEKYDLLNNNVKDLQKQLNQIVQYIQHNIKQENNSIQSSVENSNQKNSVDQYSKNNQEQVDDFVENGTNSYRIDREKYKIALKFNQIDSIIQKIHKIDSNNSDLFDNKSPSSIANAMKEIQHNKIHHQ